MEILQSVSPFPGLEFCSHLWNMFRHSPGGPRLDLGLQMKRLETLTDLLALSHGGGGLDVVARASSFPYTCV